MRSPGDVPAGDAAGVDVPAFDTDGDGVADTTVAAEGIDLVLRTDVDGDGLVDQVLRIGPDGITREVPVPGTGVLDGLFGGLGGDG